MKPTASIWEGKSILITGGTGSLGHQLVERILPQRPRRLIIYSRDELKQHEMRQRWPDDAGSSLRYFVGDVRDKERLVRALDGVDIIIHAAALKQVPACEYNPAEAIKTNTLGSMNVVEAALDAEVHRVLMVSTDKAVSPANLYGCTKAAAEKLVIQANSYSGEFGPRFAVCRYGNVVGSRGSVVPLFRRQAKAGQLTITDPRMTRFWLTLSDAADLIEYSLEHMQGGEIFVPKLPSMRVTDLAEAIAPGIPTTITGIRPGEKLHESLLSDEEIGHTLDDGHAYVVQPMHPWWTTRAGTGTTLPEGFRYESGSNTKWLNVDELKALLEHAPAEGVKS